MKAKKRGKKITIEFDNKREQIDLLGALGFKNISEAMASDAEQRRGADLPQQSGTSIAATISGLYNCEVCGVEKCRQPGICEECLTPPTDEQVKKWGLA